MVLGDVHVLLISTCKGIAARDRRTVDRAIRALKLAQGQRRSVILLESQTQGLCDILFTAFLMACVKSEDGNIFVREVLVGTRGASSKTSE